MSPPTISTTVPFPPAKIAQTAVSELSLNLNSHTARYSPAAAGACQLPIDSTFPTLHFTGAPGDTEVYISSPHQHTPMVGSMPLLQELEYLSALNNENTYSTAYPLSAGAAVYTALLWLAVPCCFLKCFLGADINKLLPFALF